MQHSRDVPFRLLTSGHNQEMMPSSAAAVEFAGPRQVRVAAVALPEPGPDEVVVTTHFSGISGGTELLAYRGEIDPGVPLDDRIESPREDLVAPPHRLPADCIRVIAPGSDVAAMPTPSTDLRHGRRAAAVSVGNWMARKGVLELLDALGRLPHDRVTLHLAGRDDVEPAYTERVRGRLAVLGDRVVHHGVLNRDGIARLYAGADVFVLPSWRERTARSTARPWPLACRSSGGGLATCLTSSATESREWSSTRAISRPSPPHSTGWPATSCGGPPWRGRRAAEALRCRDGATPRQHSSRPSRS